MDDEEALWFCWLAEDKSEAPEVKARRPKTFKNVAVEVKIFRRMSNLKRSRAAITIALISLFPMRVKALIVTTLKGTWAWVTEESLQPGPGVP